MIFSFSFSSRLVWRSFLSWPFCVSLECSQTAWWLVATSLFYVSLVFPFEQLHSLSLFFSFSSLESVIFFLLSSFCIWLYLLHRFNYLSHPQKIGAISSVLRFLLRCSYGMFFPLSGVFLDAKLRPRRSEDIAYTTHTNNFSRISHKCPFLYLQFLFFFTRWYSIIFFPLFGVFER